MDERDASRENFAKKIAGDIVLSESPGATIQKWRSIFKISQRALAEKMNVMSSVVSDYEAGRRKSPGINMIKKIVESLLAVDEETGARVTHEFNSIYSDENLSDAIIDIRELNNPMPVEDIAALVKGIIISDEEGKKRKILGYTIIDSLKAIVEISPAEIERLYSLTTDRAVVFTGVTHGKSPMVAIKAANLKPGVVIFHGLKELDKIASRIAEIERIPVIISKIQTIDGLVSEMKKI